LFALVETKNQGAWQPVANAGLRGKLSLKRFVDGYWVTHY